MCSNVLKTAVPPMCLRSNCSSLHVASLLFHKHSIHQKYSLDQSFATFFEPKHIFYTRKKKNIMSQKLDPLV